MRLGIKYSIVVGCLFLLLTACSSVKVFTLEVQQPAPITLPITAQNVIVLNNAVSQPPNQSVFREYKQERFQDYPIEFDTASWVSVYTIADALSESGFFKNVEVYTKPIREDRDFLVQNNLKEDVLNDFFIDLDYDMVISVDRLVFSIDESVWPIVSDDIRNAQNIMLKIYGLLSCGAYLKDRTTPLTTFNITDSLILNSFFKGDSIEVFKSLPESMVEVLSMAMAETAVNNFLPSWVRTDRVLYTSANARMKEAYSYVNAGNWKEAISVWDLLLQQKNKAIDKAKIASNIAVAYEMGENFSEALQWAKQSQVYFNEAGNLTSQEDSDWIESYISALNKRIIDNKTLDMQMGITRS